MSPDTDINDLIATMEHLNVAWGTCGEPEGPMLDLLLRWDAISGAILDGNHEPADLFRRTAATDAPGLLPAAAIYANHVEAGWAHFDEEPHIRALFVKEMGRDPFIPAR
jgi:hypothetical protein